MHIKSKSSLVKLLSLMICLLSIMFIPTAFASGVDYNGSGSGTGSGSGIDPSKIPVGWDKYVGYRIYAITDSQEQIGNKYDFWFGSGTASEVNGLTIGNKVYSEGVYPKNTRAGLGSATIRREAAETLLNASGNNEIPRPWNGFSSGGAALRGWIYTVEEGQELCNGLRLIRGLWGEELFDKYYNSDEEMYIILEGLSCHEILNKKTEVIGYFAGTAYKWAGQCTKTGQPYGNVWLRRGTNGIFGTGIELEETWEGSNYWDNMVVPARLSVGGDVNIESNYLSATELVRNGYDVHEYTFSSLIDTSTHTWDYPLDSTPGPAPQVEDAKRDKINIIKIYCTKDKGTGEVISWDGSFIRTMNPKTISIEDEPEYTVEDWRTLRMRMTSAPSTWSNIDRLPYAKKGSSSGVVTMDPKTPNNELTLAVLLVRYKEEEEEEIVLELQESEISRYYALSQVTAWKKGYNKGLWALPSLSTVSSCPEETSHTHDSEGHCHRTYCRSTTGHLKDTSLVFKVRNTEENAYKNILATQDNKFLV